MITSESFAFDAANGGDRWLTKELATEETELPLILVNLQDSSNFLIEHVNPLKPTV